MNALATDQAKRLAETIWHDERLKEKITTELFIGEGKDKKKFPKELGENHTIENRDTIIENPPDILLTNFKMLDYALFRNNYHNLWGFNLEVCAVGTSATMGSGADSQHLLTEYTRKVFG